MDLNIDMDLNEELKVTNLNEFEENEEYYIEFINAENIHNISRNTGVFIFDCMRYYPERGFVLQFKKTKTDVTVYKFICYNHLMNNSIYLVFIPFMGAKCCNIYRIPTTDYVLK